MEDMKLHNHELGLHEKELWGKDICIVCNEEITDGQVYSRESCKANIHRSCIEGLPNEIDSPLHPRHTLSLKHDCELEKSCGCCMQDLHCHGLHYQCPHCSFRLDVQCALLDLKKNCSLMKKGKSELMHFAHEHPLIYVETKRQKIKKQVHCFVCKDMMLSGPTYGCLYCEIYIHTSCAELPRKLETPSHQDHSLYLFANGKFTPEPSVVCKGCMKKTNSFYYYCPDCYLTFEVKCLFPFPSYKEDHQHKFFKISKLYNFICQACGEENESFPWLCTICHIFVHGKCAILPQSLKIFGHNHPLHLTYNLQCVDESKEILCKLCYRKVNRENAAYICSQCNYVAHLDCVLQLHAMYDNLTFIETEYGNEEEKVGLGILHQHDLSFTDDDHDKDDKYCDGCTQLIGGPFYSCLECNFFLDEQCATLSRRIRHPIYPHILTLVEKTCSSIDDHFFCYACKHFRQGLCYQYRDDYSLRAAFELDIGCASLSDTTITHPGHKHRLYLARTRNDAHCSCCGKIADKGIIFVCIECNFFMDYQCATLPSRARHIYDSHLLNLTIVPEDDSGEYYCDICEEERDPKLWFYHCRDCFFSAHPTCALGKYRYRRRVKYRGHTHLLTFSNGNSLTKCRICNRKENLGENLMLVCAPCKFHIHGSGDCYEATKQKGILDFYTK